MGKNLGKKNSLNPSNTVRDSYGRILECPSCKNRNLLTERIFGDKLYFCPKCLKIGVETDFRAIPRKKREKFNPSKRILHEEE